MQRLLGVVELQVQVAGRAEPGDPLRARPDEPRRAAAGGARAPGADAAASRPGGCAGARLLVAALTAPQLGVLAPGGGARAAVVVQHARETARASGGLATAAGHGQAGSPLAAARGRRWPRLLAIAGALVAFAASRSTSTATRLRIRRGLVRRRDGRRSRSTASTPCGCVEGPLRQPFGLRRGAHGDRGLRGRRRRVGHAAAGGPPGARPTGVLARLVPALADDRRGAAAPAAARAAPLRPAAAAAGAAAGAALAVAASAGLAGRRGPRRRLGAAAGAAAPTATPAGRCATGASCCAARAPVRARRSSPARPGCSDQRRLPHAPAAPGRAGRLRRARGHRARRAPSPTSRTAVAEGLFAALRPAPGAGSARRRAVAHDAARRPPPRPPSRGPAAGRRARAPR